MKHRFSINYIIFLIVVLLSIGVGVLLGIKIATKPQAIAASKSLRLQGGKYTSPLLLGDIDNDKDSPLLASLSREVQGIVNQHQKDGDIVTASVFYRTLKSGNQITINDREQYMPASLTKLPLMMAYLKMSESDLDLLNTRGPIEFQQDYNTNQEIVPADSPKSGQEYSIDELITLMIKYSDNTSFQLLMRRQEVQETLKGVYQDYQLVYPFNSLGQADNDITAREYSRFLRALYNATYLGTQNSEKALDLLAQSDFKAGIKAGVPVDVVVADKYGLYADQDGAGHIIGRQLHDCGIVYHPDKPYVLCIMTKSTASIEQIEKVIKQISETAYKATNG